MPSFDVVSEVDNQEVINAVDQANREIRSRFDFKNVDASFEFQDEQVRLAAEAEIQVEQMTDVLRGKLIKRSIDPAVMELQEIEHSGKKFYRNVQIKQGVSSEIGRKIVKLVKDRKLKVQTAIQGDKVRVTGKKRDDLQQVIALLRAAELDIPLQYNNFRD